MPEYYNDKELPKQNIESRIEAELPNTKYVTKFSIEHWSAGDNFLTLKLELPQMFANYELLKEQLLQNDIPITAVEKGKTFWGDHPKVKFTGKVSEEESYSLTSKEIIDSNSAKYERITLDAKIKDKNLHKLISLVRVINQYTQGYEQHKKIKT